MTRVLMSGRKDERLFLCPWTPPFSFCSAASVFCTLKHTVTSTTTQSFFSAARRKKGLLDKSHFSKWRGHAKAEIITLVEWKQGKQIANTETNIGDVWLHSKLRPISSPFFLHVIVVFSMPFFVRLISPLPFSIPLSEQQGLFNFQYLCLSFIYSALEFSFLSTYVTWCPERFSPVCCEQETWEPCVPSQTVSSTPAVLASLDICNKKCISRKGGGG